MTDLVKRKKMGKVKILGIKFEYYKKGNRPIWMKLQGKTTPKEIRV